jgi:hypothetical protein
MTIVQAGSLNTTALIVPDLIVQIVPPSVSLLNGVPTNIFGIVGTAQWGPLNSPVVLGSMADYALAFGSVQNRKYDMGTILATAVLQGAANFRGVRVSDGTDVAASVIIQANCLTLTGRYSGTLGNSIVASVGAGSAAGTSRITIAMPNRTPEVFDNIAGSAGALWVAMAAAINNGQNALRGKSDLVVASAGVGVPTPAVASYTLNGGTDGAGISATALVGVDTTPRTGMYALRGTGASIGVLADCDTASTWTTQVSFGLGEGIYMIGVGPAGDTPTAAAAAKASAGIDSYAFKLLHGDWIFWADPVAGITRLVSPQGFVGGKMANLSPEQSPLNKPLYGIVGTQRTAANLVYSNAELQVLAQAGIDLITNPVPGGNYFGVRIGHNTSSNPVVYGDNYTRMTNYLASTFNAGMGQFVGKLQSVQKDDPTRRQAGATLSTFLQNMRDQVQVDDFSVICDLSNNTPSRIALGYMQADVKVRYLSIVEKFLVNLEGGQSVQVARQQTATV